jgi:hypothetical protein
MGRGGLPRVVDRNVGWATAWQPSPAGQPACATCCSARAGAVTTRRPRVGRRGGMLVGGSIAARCCRRSQGGHGEGAGQGGEGRGAPERRIDGEAVQTASGGGVRRWGGGSGGRRRG